MPEYRVEIDFCTSLEFYLDASNMADARDEAQDRIIDAINSIEGKLYRQGINISRTLVEESS